MAVAQVHVETVSYIPGGGGEEEQKLDLYMPIKDDSVAAIDRLIIFIHGGAWRTGSRKDHADLATHLCSSSTTSDGGAVNVAVAVIDYRLSTLDETTQRPKHIHPSHCTDTVAALKYLQQRQDLPQSGWTLVGHSIGAWLTLATLVIDQVPDQKTGQHKHNPNQQYPKPFPTSPRGIRKSIKTCVLVDGIYSVTKLLEEYPDYRGFVSQAFLPSSSDAGIDYSPVSIENTPLDVGDKSFHIWHSRDDELLSFRQSLDFVSFLDRQISQHQQSSEASIGHKDPTELIEIPKEGLASITTDLETGEKVPIHKLYPNASVHNPSSLFVDLINVKGAHDVLLHTKDFFEKLAKLLPRAQT